MIEIKINNLYKHENTIIKIIKATKIHYKFEQIYPVFDGDFFNAFSPNSQFHQELTELSNLDKVKLL